MNTEEREQSSANEQLSREDSMQNKNNDLGTPLDNSVTNDEEQLIAQELERGYAQDDDDNLDNEDGIDGEAPFDQDDDSEDYDSEDDEDEDFEDEDYDSDDDETEDDDSEDDDSDDEEDTLDEEDDYKRDDMNYAKGDNGIINPINPDRF